MSKPLLLSSPNEHEAAGRAAVPRQSAAPTRSAKKRGARLATGPFATREAFEDEVLWFYENTSMSVEAIGKRLQVSQGTANRALQDAQRRRHGARPEVPTVPP